MNGGALVVSLPHDPRRHAGGNMDLIVEIEEAWWGVRSREPPVPPAPPPPPYVRFLDPM